MALPEAVWNVLNFEGWHSQAAQRSDELPEMTRVLSAHTPSLAAFGGVIGEMINEVNDKRRILTCRMPDAFYDHSAISGADVDERPSSCMPS